MKAQHIKQDENGYITFERADGYTQTIGLGVTREGRFFIDLLTARVVVNSTFDGDEDNAILKEPKTRAKRVRK